MEIEFDPDKRNKIFAERGLDLGRVAELFAGPHIEVEDIRTDYGEPRFITIGALDGRLMVVVWTPRGERRRIISLR